MHCDFGYSGLSVHSGHGMAQEEKYLLYKHGDQIHIQNRAQWLLPGILVLCGSGKRAK